LVGCVFFSENPPTLTRKICVHPEKHRVHVSHQTSATAGDLDFFFLLSRGKNPAHKQTNKQKTHKHAMDSQRQQQQQQPVADAFPATAEASQPKKKKKKNKKQRAREAQAQRAAIERECLEWAKQRETDEYLKTGKKTTVHYLPVTDELMNDPFKLMYELQRWQKRVDKNLLPKRCEVCGTTEGIHWCSKCHGIGYCSRECQLKDWPVHKKECDELREANSYYCSFCKTRVNACTKRVVHLGPQDAHKHVYACMPCFNKNFGRNRSDESGGGEKLYKPLTPLARELTKSYIHVTDPTGLDDVD
jgi:hypothetical protein